VKARRGRSRAVSGWVWSSGYRECGKRDGAWRFPGGNSRGQKTQYNVVLARKRACFVAIARDERIGCSVESRGVGECIGRGGNAGESFVSGGRELGFISREPNFFKKVLRKRREVHVGVHRGG